MKSLSTKLPPEITTALAARRRRTGRGRTPEGKVIRACLDLLNLRGWPAWRMNSGSLRDKGGRPVRFILGPEGEPFSGFADVLAISPVGRWLSAELKRPGGRPTILQSAFLELIRSRNGVALLVEDVAILARALDALAVDPWARLDLAGNVVAARSPFLFAGGPGPDGSDHPRAGPSDRGEGPGEARAHADVLNPGGFHA